MFAAQNISIISILDWIDKRNLHIHRIVMTDCFIYCASEAEISLLAIYPTQTRNMILQM